MEPGTAMDFDHPVYPRAGYIKVALPGVTAGRMGWGNRFKEIPDLYYYFLMKGV